MKSTQKSTKHLSLNSTTKCFNFKIIVSKSPLLWAFLGSLSTVVGDEKLTSRENLIGFLFLYVQSDENTLPKVNKVSKTEAQTFDVFDKLIGPLQFCI